MPAASGCWSGSAAGVRRGRDGARAAREGRERAGEFLTAARLRIDSLIDVYDPQLSRESVFARTGEFVATRSMPSLGGFGSALRLPLAGGAFLVVTTPRFSMSPAGHDPYSRVALAIGERLDTVASIRSSGGLWQHGSAYGVFETDLGDGGAWALAADSVLALVDGYAGQVEWRCAPRFDVCARHELAEPAANRRAVDRAALVQRATEQSRRPLRSDEVVDAPVRRSGATGAALSSDGRWLWVQNDGDYRGGERYTVVDRERGPAGVVTFATPTRLLAVSPDGLLIRRQGEFEETIVEWLDWRRWPPF